MAREIKFRAWDKEKKEFTQSIEGVSMDGVILDLGMSENGIVNRERDIILMQYTGLKDKNGVEIYEGDIVGREGVYHFIDRSDWKPSAGNWKIIGNKTKDFTGKGEEDYIAGYELFLVEWEGSSCGFEPFSDSKENCGHCGGGYNPKDFEVIGNKHENPELLVKN